ncbi:hypothetical protein [Kitasatospora sp. NPDC050463]|uniref:hypothetical protein n=1 Tax=Kitasatospora sp. NPDC050463 TaxID=3155786 RepID=UPI0033CEAB21
MTASQEQQGGPGLPEQRSARHAAPRTPVRVRLRGRALAMAAVPTALLMAAAYTPNAAIAETAAGKPCATAPDVAPQPPTVAETPVPKSELPPPLPGPSVPLPATTPAAPTASPTAAPSSGPTSAPTTAATTPATPTTPTTPASTPASGPVRSATTGGSGGVVQAGLIGDIVGGITNLILPSGSPSPSASATTASPTPSTPAAPAAVAPAAAAAGTRTPTAPAPPSAAATTPPAVPSGAQSPSAAPTPSGRASGTAKPSAGAKAGGSATPTASSSRSASSSPSADPNCLVPMKGLAAGARPDNPILVPDQNWTLQTSRLTLNHAVLMGVVDVQTPTTTKRVLKFVVESVDIENLDMSTLEGNGKTFHVKGAPGSVSTMRQGPVTMYVEKLSGHLSQVLGIPIPIDLGELTLTPDGPLPQWLYDLIGKLEIPLWMQMTGVTAIQSGQFGGTLKIPGMQLFNDDKPYVGNK